MNSGIKNTLDNSKYFFKICERIILSISKENSSPPEAWKLAIELQIQAALIK
jgi:hypothetical protein